MKKIHFSVGNVLPKVAQVAQLVNQKNTIPILENVMLQSYNGQFLNITASDGETWLLVSTKVELIEDNIEYCVNAQRLNTALKSLGSNEEVVAEFNEQNHIAKFIYSSGNFELPFLDGVNFPNPSQTSQTEENTFAIELESKRLFNGISLTEFATDNDSLHPQFNGIHVDFVNNEEKNVTQIIFVSTDTRKLVRYTQDLNSRYDEFNGKGFTLPKKAALTIIQILSNQEKEQSCAITFNDRNFVIQTDSSKLSTRLIAGNFPNYNLVIPTNYDKKAIVGRDSLIGALKRVMAFANQKTLMATLTFDDNHIVLDTKDIDYNTSAQEIIDCTYYGEPIAIGFPCNGLIDVVRNVRNESVQIKMIDSTKAGMIIPSEEPDDEEYVSIQMPMQIW